MHSMHTHWSKVIEIPGVEILIVIINKNKENKNNIKQIEDAY
jgi:hypothetical protein